MHFLYLPPPKKKEKWEGKLFLCLIHTRRHYIYIFQDLDLISLTDLDPMMIEKAGKNYVQLLCREKVWNQTPSKRW